MAPSGGTRQIASKPGYFASSNPNMTDIWQLGPRTRQLACFPPNSQPSTWEVDATKGAYIRGQKPATTVKGANAANYTLAFEANIDYGGVGWRLDTEIDNIWAQGPYRASFAVSLPCGCRWKVCRLNLPELCPLRTQSFSRATTPKARSPTTTAPSSRPIPSSSVEDGLCRTRQP